MTVEIVLMGEVVSGNKNGKLFVGLPWVTKQINKKLGFNPYLGTLNLRLPNKTSLNRLHEADGIIIVSEMGYCEGKCFKALVKGKVEGAVVLPLVPDYPSDLLEIIAPVNLRKTLGLSDGMTIEVAIRVE